MSHYQSLSGIAMFQSPIQTEKYRYSSLSALNLNRDLRVDSPPSLSLLVPHCTKASKTLPTLSGLKGDLSGEFEEAVRMTIKCINRPAKYFAKTLYLSVKGVNGSADDNSVTRVIVTRAEIDMREIKTEFLRKYQKLLDDVIKNSTTGNHRSFLLKLIGSKVDV